jgi:predicted transcriptional regulator
MDIGPAVEEALLPLRLKACGLVVRKVDSVLKEVDAALQHVHQEHNHSRKAIKRFVQANVFLSLKDGHFHSSLEALQSHLGQGGHRLSRKIVKRFPYARMCMIKA